MKITNILIFIGLIIMVINTNGNTLSNTNNTSRWTLLEEGQIKWEVKKDDTHIDHVEMSGFHIAAIVHYGVEKGLLGKSIKLVYPMLRTIPNDTHASLMIDYNDKDIPKFKINGQDIEERPAEFKLRGILSHTSVTNEGLIIEHKLYPSTDKPVFIDKINLRNNSGKQMVVDIPKINIIEKTDADKGAYGVYVLEVTSNLHGEYKLEANDSLEYAIIYLGRKESDSIITIDPSDELQKRIDLINNTFSNLTFECPDEVLQRTFDHAKLRAVESIYKTKAGLMHGPGGGRYYAAIWANDQAEYANPFFPYLGNEAGNLSAVNSFKHFARYMNDDFDPIPSSIIAEGDSYWNGVGDRGDMAMIAYGATRFALSFGNEDTAKELWPLIEWCLEYCKRKINEEGVVTSDCDELEHRFPAGKANLNTSSLYYDALLSSVYLGNEIGISKDQLKKYSSQSENLKISIEKYFGANIDGFDTYRYYEGNKVLRSWICTPLTVGIYERSAGTIDALFSEKLWTEDGLATESGNKTFWDRATLYALRGVFAAGETKKAMDFLKYYSERRLLGEHVPYPVEAYPEGNQRHLSAESALYCRIVTEGIFGIRPEGFNTFAITPRLPDDWDSMALKNIKAFNNGFDIQINREKDELHVKVFNKQNVYFDSKIDNGSTIKIKL